VAASKAKKIKAKDLYTELDLTLGDLKDYAAQVGVDVKAWNSALTPSEAEKIRVEVKVRGPKLKAERDAAAKIEAERLAVEKAAADKLAAEKAAEEKAKAEAEAKKVAAAEALKAKEAAKQAAVDAAKQAEAEAAKAEADAKAEAEKQAQQAKADAQAKSAEDEKAKSKAKASKATPKAEKEKPAAKAGKGASQKMKAAPAPKGEAAEAETAPDAAVDGQEAEAPAGPKALDIGIDDARAREIAEQLQVDVSEPEAVSEDDVERIKACDEIYAMASDLSVSFADLCKFGARLGIEIGRAGFRGLSAPEKLLLKAQVKAKFGGSMPGVQRASEQDKPKFAAPTGNKAENERPTQATRPQRGSPRGAPGGDTFGGGAPAAGPGAAAGAAGRRGGPGGGRGQPTGRRRFEVRDNSYANQRSGGRSVGSNPNMPKKPEMPTGPVTVDLPINMRELSEALGVKVNDILGELMREGIMVRINDSLSQDMIENIGITLDREIKIRAPKTADELIEQALEKFDDDESMQHPRAPIVTVMGHVDHGKTSLLDAINHLDRASGEAGGITQHIGAFRIEVDREENGPPMEVTFIDTPGHEAFTAMRARGASVTDVAVIVVAADDGVMPQTEEAIAHAKAANVEIVVAINKIDKPDANVARTRQLLANFNLISPDWGGTTEICEVSATTGQGIKELVQTLADLTDLLELRANAEKPAVGTVLEAHRSEGRGIVATVLVQDGTLRKGQAIVAGHGYGRVRAMYDSRGRELPDAGPAIPVQVTGLSELPEAGAHFYAMDDYKKAQAIAGRITQQERELERARNKPLTLEQWSASRSEQVLTELKIVLKADVQGTAETIRSELAKFDHEEVGIKLIHSAVGVVTSNDVHLAQASDAIIVAFSTTVQPKAHELADMYHVEIRQYDVIYKLLEDVRAALAGLLRPEEVEVEQGEVEVRQIFKASKIGTIAGCYVTDGIIQRTSRVRIYREKEELYDGPIESLKRFKDEVKEVREGFECGLVFKRFNDLKQGDIIKPYAIETRERTLELGEKTGS